VGKFAEKSPFLICIILFEKSVFFFSFYSLAFYTPSFIAGESPFSFFVHIIVEKVGKTTKSVRCFFLALSVINDKERFSLNCKKKYGAELLVHSLPSKFSFSFLFALSLIDWKMVCEEEKTSKNQN
jgi:hypothetical protein